MRSLPSLAPRCLAGFIASRVPNEAAGISAEWSFGVFALGCPCGADVWRVLAHRWEDPDLTGPDALEGPLAAACARCDATRELIDTNRDGYNAGIGDRREQVTGQHGIWTCDRCQKPEGRLVAAFGYQYDADDDSDPDFADKWRDMFDAFILAHRCLNEDRVVQVAMFDCA